MANAPDLNALVGSRICHDLISPLGAIGNGVELMTMTGANASPEMALIAESVSNANARIRFFRVAFGAASPGQSLGRAETAAILADITKGSRLKVQWNGKSDSLRAEVKLAFLLFQCFESAMPYGGELVITQHDAGWTMDGTADKLRIVPETWGLISDPHPPTEISAAEVQFALIPELAQRMGRTMVVDLKDHGIRVDF